MPTKEFSWPADHEDLRRLLAALAVPSKRRPGRRARPTVRTYSVWDGDDRGWEWAPVVFRVLSAMSIPCRSSGGNETAALVAEILDATAWALNRGDTRILHDLGKLARVWNRREAPLVAKSMRDVGPRPVRSYATKLQAYEAAVQWLEQWLMKPPDPDFASEVTAWDALAWEALMVIRSPLPQVRLEQEAEGRKSRARQALANHVKDLMDAAKSNAKPIPGRPGVRVPLSVDVERVIKRALRLAGMPDAEITKLSDGLKKRGLRKSKTYL